MVYLVRDPIYKKHSNGPGHPESPQRLAAIDRMLEGFPQREQVEDLPARDATIDELSWVHERSYIRLIEETQQRSFTMLDPDTGTTADSFGAALRAAGGTMVAVDGALSEGGSAFAFVRPPGHHAEANRAMGFCLFNNIAIAAHYALKIYGLQRLLILDWDVHHGNGTMNAFYDSDEVMYFSIHQYPHYPGTGRMEEIGRGAGKGYTINVPLAGGQRDADYYAVLREVFVPLSRLFSPQLILISAGFDAHESDPLAFMGLTGRGYGGITDITKAVADEHCPGKIVCTLEGGYDIDALTDGVSHVLQSLLGAGEPEVADGPVSGYVRGVIEEVRALHGLYWALD